MMTTLLMAMPDFAKPEIWVSLLTLTFLEIVLGIDNIIFITIAANRLPKSDQAKARNIGLILAMIFRVLLLLGISVFMAMQEPFVHVNMGWFSGAITGQAVILFAGGIFLLYKATNEIYHKLEGDDMGPEKTVQKGKSSITAAILQIALINIVFSFDSILTAIGLTPYVIIMIIAVVASILIMMLFAGPVGQFVNDHPSIQMLGLAFLILIGFMLVAEAAHLAEISIFHSEIGSVPKGYLYFAIAFSLFVEFLNIKLRKRQKPVQLHGMSEEAEKEGLFDNQNPNK